jgi:DNA-binding HxlR family transcriptional regulator
MDGRVACDGIHWLSCTSTCYKYLMVTIAGHGLADEPRPGQADGSRGSAFDPDCATRLVLDRIGDKWTALVILLLADGPQRFTQLRGHVGRVAPKVLTQTLRRMERDGLVTREVFAEVPPRVEYALTDLGKSLTKPIAVIAEWAEVNVGRITAAQQAYDDAPQR